MYFYLLHIKPIPKFVLQIQLSWDYKDTSMQAFNTEFRTGDPEVN